MKLKSNRKWSALALSVASSITAAQAEVSVQHFNATANSTYTLTEDALLDVAPGDSSWNGSRFLFGAHYNWVNDPLIAADPNRTSRTLTLVDSVQTINLLLGWVPLENFAISVDAPLNLVHLANSGTQFGFGDLRAMGKWRLTSRNAVVAVSLIPELRLPTGNQNMLVSDGSLSPGLSVAFERDFGPLRASANIGYRYASQAEFRDINYRHRLPMALGIFAPLGPRWGINAEAAGSIVLPRDAFNNPGELYLGARYQFNRSVVAMSGISLGSVNSDAANDLRLSFGVRFAPMPEAKSALPVTPVAAPAVKEPKRVVFTPKEIKILEEIKFKHASAELTPSGKSILDEVVYVMQKNRKSYTKIMIEGHTNELGTYPYNQDLSERRAKSVRDYLVSQGIKENELLTIGYGKTKPKNTKGLNKDARLAANRRVEFKVIN